MRGTALHNRSMAERAFTLLEMLVASAIFAIVMASLYVVFYSAIRLREKTFKEVESALPVSAIEMIVKRDLSSTVVPAGLLSGPFIGETDEKAAVRSDQLTFFASSGTIEDNNPWGDVQQIEYYLAEPENGDQEAGSDLVRALTRNLLSPVVEDPEEQRILHGVSSLLFEYYDGTQWQDYWDSTTMGNTTPTAVRVRIEFAQVNENEKPARPIEAVCELLVKAPTTSSGSQSAGGDQTGGGGNTGR